MTDTLVQTKLFIPPLRPSFVPRPRLIQKLNEGMDGKLALISAPAGFGKTTLVSEWLAALKGENPDIMPAQAGTRESLRAKQPVAWLSLSEGDSDLPRFLTYVVAAIQTVRPEMGGGMLALLQSPQPPSTDVILTTLLNEITPVPKAFSYPTGTHSELGFILVLDDYHVLDARSVDDALTFLIEHLPPQVYIVITTREDPPLPLARYRVRGQLTEVRAADLRFTPDEAAAFLNQVMGLTLSADQIAALERRTEGWIAGLQMAALSMQGHQDLSRFIQSFTGSHHFILDYLIEEVLYHQPDYVRSFLLQTAILDRLSGPLCDAVTSQEDGKEILANLERGNLFVIPLDDERCWYRYHHLFADVLQARLMEEQPEQLPILHQRASIWYEENGFRADAIHHAFAAEDLDSAANLVELTWPTFHRSDFRSAALLGWLQALPDSLIRARPVLSVGYAWELLNHGQIEAADSWLRTAEAWLDQTPDGGEYPAAPAEEMVVADEVEFRTLPAEIASARTYHALAIGDVSSTMKYAQLALDLLPEDAHIQRGPAASLLGLAYWTKGELEAAYQTLAVGMANLEMAGNIAFAIACTSGLVDIRMAQGRLRDAISVYERALQLAKADAGPALQGTTDLYLGLAELFHEQGDVERSADFLRKMESLGEQAAISSWQLRLCLFQSRIKTSRDDLENALNFLDKAEQLYVRTPLPDVRPIAALKARIRLKQGNLMEALAWTRAQHLSVEDDLSYLREFDHITLARVLIAQYRMERKQSTIHQAIGLLERLQQAAEDEKRAGSSIEILVVQSLAYEAQDDIALALVPLERALTLAEPEGFVRIFVDEGEPMIQLLKAARTRGIMPVYTGKLLAAFAGENLQRPSESLPSTSSPPSTATSQPLIAQRAFAIEPLSQRELEVLQLIAEGLSNREISERLFLALSTVKGHNRVIFGKLQVQRRTEAVARARELGLV